MTAGPQAADISKAADNSLAAQSNQAADNRQAADSSTSTDTSSVERPSRGSWLTRLRTLWSARVRPALAIITPVGWAVISLATFAWILGLLWNNIELTVLALALTIPLLVAVGFVLGKTQYKVSLDLASHRVVVGSQAVGRVLLENPTQRTLLPSRIELNVGEAIAQFLVPSLGVGGEHEELFQVPTARRSVLEIGPVRSVRDDPLSLVRRNIIWAPAQDVFVHPRTVRLDEAASGYLRDLEGTPSSHLSSSDIAFHALREYSPGDDLRHVHWRTTARTGKMMVRQFEETRRSHVVVALDNRRSKYASENEFEMSVSAAASMAGQTFRDEKELTAITHNTSQRSETYRALMDDYTVVEAIDDAPHSLQELGQKAADEAPNASAVMLVVGSEAGPTELHAAASRLPLGVIAVAILCRDGASVERSSIGDLNVVTIGNLEDLPRALRAVS